MKEDRQLYEKWIQDIAQAILSDKEKKNAFNPHLLKHAKEVEEMEPRDWSASMQNLLDIFNAVNNIEPSIKLQIERLQRKYEKDPQRYTPPPVLKK